MKNIALIITIILFLVIFMTGHLHWKNEIEQNAKKAEAQVETINDNDTAQDHSKSAKVKTTTEVAANGSNHNFDTLTKSLPEDVKTKIVKAHDQNQSVTLVLAGGKEISGLSSLLQAKLDAAYGKDLFKVIEANFQDQNSLSVYQGKLYTKITEAKPDIVIFTPLLFNDIGKVSTSDSSRVPILIEHRMHEVVPETVFMIEPPNPVTYNNAINERVDAAKTEADNAGLDYIDHLTSWPTGSDLDADLDNQGKYPNDQGLKLWADALAGYFTSAN